MAVDSSIYNALGPRLKSVSEFEAEAQDRDARKQNMLLNALGIQQQQQALALNQQKMVDSRAEREQMAGLGQWLATADTKAPDFAAQVYQRAPMAAGGVLKDFAARDKDAAAADKERLAATKTRLDLILQATSSAKDQASYTQARNVLASQGVDVTSIPEQFDPAYVAAAGQQAMTQAQRLEQVWKQKGYDLDVQKAGESARHNKAQEGLTARGQNLADARSRESNEINRQAARTQVLETADGVMLVDKGTGLSRPAATINGQPLAGKLPEAARKQISGIDALGAAIDDYRAQLKKWGAVDIARPDARAAMGTAYNNMMLQAKEAYNLGVLNGPDYSILTSVVTDPTTLKGAITSNGAMDQQASELDRLMQRTRSAVAGKRPGSAQPAQGGNLTAAEQAELEQLRKQLGR